MNWVSLTRRVKPREMYALQYASAEALMTPMLLADPLVTMRLLAELMLHEDSEKLQQFLAMPDINEHWRQWDKDEEVEEADREYAKKLEEKLKALQS